MKISYRPVQRENAEEMRFVAYVDSRIPLEHDPLFKWQESDVEGRVQMLKKAVKPDDFFDVAVAGGRIVGFHVIKAGGFPSELKPAFVLTTWTDPEMRGRGIAGELKARGETWARDASVGFLQTNVNASNPRMREINEQNGYQVSSFVMRKML